MNAEHEQHLSPEIAAAEVQRVTRQVQHRGRWPGWMWLVMAVVTCGFFLATGSGNRLLTDVVGPLPLVAAVVIYLLASRQPVVARRALASGDKQLSYAFLATVVVGTAIDLTVLPKGFSAWLVLLAVLMAVPCLVGSWRWLHS